MAPDGLGTSKEWGELGTISKQGVHKYYRGRRLAEGVREELGEVKLGRPLPYKIILMNFSFIYLVNCE